MSTACQRPRCVYGIVSWIGKSSLGIATATDHRFLTYVTSTAPHPISTSTHPSGTLDGNTVPPVLPQSRRYDALLTHCFRCFHTVDSRTTSIHIFVTILNQYKLCRHEFQHNRSTMTTIQGISGGTGEKLTKATIIVAGTMSLVASLISIV